MALVARSPPPAAVDTPPEGAETAVETGCGTWLLLTSTAAARDLLAGLRSLVAAGIRNTPLHWDSQRGELLQSRDIEGIARYIKQHHCTRVVVMCGAGISTSAGIPDFRTPGTGLYDNLQRFSLPRPEAIFDLGFFRRRPGAFYELCREMWPGNFQPTPAHYFIRLLQEKGLLLRCYTQNIDSLEKQAGIPIDKIVAAHGNFDSAHVVGRGVDVEIEELKAALEEEGDEGWQALQAKHGGLVKPAITFFGEQLPRRYFELSGQDLASCDLLIVLGTSLQVRPFALLVGEAAKQVPRLLINNEPVGSYDQLPNGFSFHPPEGESSRDVFYKGNCDTGCRALAAALGWGEELEALVSSRGNLDTGPQRTSLRS